jgi:hypothetical protein
MRRINGGGKNANVGFNGMNALASEPLANCLLCIIQTMLCCPRGLRAFWSTPLKFLIVIGIKHMLMDRSINRRTCPRGWRTIFGNRDSGSEQTASIALKFHGSSRTLICAIGCALLWSIEVRDLQKIDAISS